MRTKVKDLPVDSIIVGTRRREDYGDMDAYAAKVERRGYVPPIGIDDNRNLVYGGRRLMACEMLGWKTIPCMLLGDLTPQEIREIELEENLNRKDFTPFELSKMMVEMAEIINENAASEFIGHDVQIIQSGRPKEPITKAETAEQMDVSARTLKRAEQHVKAVAKYPDLAGLPQAEALRIAAERDKAGKAKKPSARGKVTPTGISLTLPQIPDGADHWLIGDAKNFYHKVDRDGRVSKYDASAVKEHFGFNGTDFSLMDELVKSGLYVTRTAVLRAALVLLHSTESKPVTTSTESKPTASEVPTPSPRPGFMTTCDICHKEMRKLDVKRNLAGVGGHGECLRKAA